jgi:hypothetical protein
MKLLISEGNFARITAGLSPIERARLAEQVQLYPDDAGQPLIEADQERIGAAWEKLLRDDPLVPVVLPYLNFAPRRSPWPLILDEVHAFAEGVRRTEPVPGDQRSAPAGTDITLPPPWEELGPGWWVAPAGTMPPWPHDEDADDDPVGDLRRGLAALDGKMPPPRRLEAGESALFVLLNRSTPRDREGWQLPNDLAGLAQVPIVLNSDLPDSGWRIVDMDTGAVQFEGTLGPSAEKIQAVIGEVIDDLAERTGIPRDLLG